MLLSGIDAEVARPPAFTPWLRLLPCAAGGRYLDHPLARPILPHCVYAAVHVHPGKGPETEMFKRPTDAWPPMYKRFTILREGS